MYHAEAVAREPVRPYVWFHTKPFFPGLIWYTRMAMGVDLMLLILVGNALSVSSSVLNHCVIIKYFWFGFGLQLEMVLELSC